MVLDIEMATLRRLFMHATPKGAKEYLDSLSKADADRFLESEKAAGYLEGISRVADALRSRPKVVRLVIEKGLKADCKRCGKAHVPICDKCGKKAGEGPDFRSMHGPCDRCAFGKKSLVIDLDKAILTKPSEKRERPVKQARQPTKAAAKYVDPKNGKTRYNYSGQTPNKGKAGGKAAASPMQGTPGGDPAKPPKLDVEELATVLKTTTGALKTYAKTFRTAPAFVAHASMKMAPFLRKHSIGPDKLRRLWEQLTAE